MAAQELPAVPWSFLAERTARNPIRALSIRAQELRAEGKDLCVMAGGRPTVDMFPLRALSVVAEGMTHGVDEGSGTRTAELATDVRLNYCPTLSFGLPDLRAWCKAHVQSQHTPPPEVGHDTIVTPGNTHGMSLSMAVLSNPGDIVLTTDYAYTGIFASAAPLGRRVVGVETDAEGPLASAIDAVCVEAAGAPPHSPRPRLLYVVPTGCNPTGATISAGRRRELYDICCKHDLWIIEDDPYVYLTMGGPDAAKPEGMPGAAITTPSFLSMDIQGRVVRLDSFSKTIAPGIRVGWLTARAEVVQKATQCSEVLSWTLSGVSQTVLLTLLQGWGPEGFDAHLRRIQHLYRTRRDRLHAAASAALTGLADWVLPDAGMFIWFDFTKSNVTDGYTVVDALLDAGVAMVPGTAFAAPRITGDAPSCPCFRASFSNLLDDAAVERAMGRLAKVLTAIRDAPAGSGEVPPMGPVGTALGRRNPEAVLERKRREAVALEAQLAALRGEIAELSKA
eukprot:m.61726 g.61726  ORF g.61726 m.61726 type:complete len:507 (+) comp9576_c0_seq1:1383-2903(+)